MVINMSDLIQISIKLPSELLQAIDLIAINERKFRSEIIREALIFYLTHRNKIHTKEI